MSVETLVEILPAINASLNACATLCLTIGFILIRKDREKNQNAHRACMLSAFSISVVFLVLYVSHKFLKNYVGADINTAFTGEGFWRWIYYPMLLSHVLLAMIIVPLILVTLFYAFKGRYETHRKWARWTFPMWYYVSVTGVLVYFFLYQWFPSSS